MAETFEFELQVLAGNHSNERKGKIKRKKKMYPGRKDTVINEKQTYFLVTGYNFLKFNFMYIFLCDPFKKSLLNLLQ